MRKKSTQLAERREHLIAQAAAQRLILAQNLAPWRAPLARVDQGLAVLNYLKHHPAWIIGAGAALTALRPGRAFKWLRLGWVSWQSWRKLRG